MSDKVVTYSAVNLMLDDVLVQKFRFFGSIHVEFGQKHKVRRLSFLPEKRVFCRKSGKRGQKKAFFRERSLDKSIR